MPILSRNTPKLLTLVGRKQHASSDDHEEPVRPRKDPAFRLPTLRETSAPTADSSQKPEKRLPPSLPLEATRTIPRKRKEPEINDLSNSSAVKKTKLAEQGKERAAPRVQKSKAEKSLPSPESIESGKRRTARMQTETDFDADPASSSDVEQHWTVAGAQRNGNGAGSMTTRRSSLGSTNSPGSNIHGEGGMTRSRTSAIDSKRLSNGSASGFKSIEFPNLLSSRTNNTLPKKEFKNHAAMAKTIADEELGSSDDEIFPGTKNIFADPANKRQKQGGSASQSLKPQTTYGRRDAAKRRKIRAPKKGFQQAADKAKAPAPPEPRFKRYELGDEFSSQSTNAVTSSALAPEFQADNNDSPLSDLEPEEAETISIDGFTMITCDMCSVLVKKMLQEEYEDRELQGRRWTYRWQQRFCTWHKKQTAEEIWKERGYPDIQWDRLKQRMRKHDKFISDVLNDRVVSHHRQKLQDSNKQGRKRQKDIIAEGTSKFTMGYYGPKGERRV